MTAVVLMVTLLGNHPLWPIEDLTLAEAALLRDDGEVVRLIGLGENPNGHYRIRSTLTHRSSRHRSSRQGSWRHRSSSVVTPLEAAVLASRPMMVRLLLAHGALPDTGTWTAVCESESKEIAAIRALLDPLTPSMPCRPIRDADRTLP